MLHSYCCARYPEATALHESNIKHCFLVCTISWQLMAGIRAQLFVRTCVLLQAIRRALKHAPGILISKLRRLAADATPLSIHTRADDTYDATGAAATSVAAAPDSPAEGAAAANGRPGAGDATWGFKQLPDEQFEQASLLLWAAEWKLATFNQVCRPDTSKHLPLQNRDRAIVGMPSCAICIQEIEHRWTIHNSQLRICFRV